MITVDLFNYLKVWNYYYNINENINQADIPDSKLFSKSSLHCDWKYYTVQNNIIFVQIIPTCKQVIQKCFIAHFMLII